MKATLATWRVMGCFILGSCLSEAQPQTNSLPGASIHLNFRGAPLDQVLEHFASAAGFTVLLQAEPKGTVDLFSSSPVTPAEALTLLDSALGRHGLTALRRGNTLTIITREEAKTREIPVMSAERPEDIPSTEAMVTQIIPVKYTEATQLLKDLQPLVAANTVITANESANTIVITDSQARIRRVAQIIAAIDTGSETLTELRVFRLTNADPAELAEVLSQVFPQEPTANNQGGRQFGGFPGFGGPGGFSPGGRGAPAASSGSQRLKKGMRVTAVADPRTSSLVVTAPRELIPQVEGIVQRLDSNPARKESVHVIQLENSSAEQVAQVLREVFARNSTSTARSANSQADILQNRTQQGAQGVQGVPGMGAGGGIGGQGVGSGIGGGQYGF